MFNVIADSSLCKLQMISRNSSSSLLIRCWPSAVCVVHCDRVRKMRLEGVCKQEKCVGAGSVMFTFVADVCSTGHTKAIRHNM